MSWAQRVNAGRNIHEFVDEESIRDHVRVSKNAHELNWMKIFNSKIELSYCFISEFSHHINWNWLIRPLSESVLRRFERQVVQWTLQLYGPIRTIDFMVEYRRKFEWIAISASPPRWFTSLHFEIFADLLDWKLLSNFTSRMDRSIIVRMGERLDWNVVTSLDIRDEEFATMFINEINWDHPRLNVKNLSEEFLEKVNEIRTNAKLMSEDEFNDWRFGNDGSNNLLRWARYEISREMDLTEGQCFIPAF